MNNPNVHKDGKLVVTILIIVRIIKLNIILIIKLIIIIIIISR